MKIFQHDGGNGDIIYSLPIIYAFGGGTLYITNKNRYQFIASLLELQGLIIKEGFGPKEIINFRGFRYIDKAARKRGPKHLLLCHSELLNITCDLTQKWLKVAPTHKYDIVINRTRKFHDKKEIDWKLLYDYNSAFIGYDNDFKLFQRETNLSWPKIKYNNALEMTQIIAGSKLFVGNQSFAFSVAEGLKHPRVLEVYYQANNCQPHGNDGYTYLTKELIERYLND